MRPRVFAVFRKDCSRGTAKTLAATLEKTVVDTIEAGEMMLNEYMTVRFYPVYHTDQSLGYRIEDSQGRSIAYSGDTGPCDGLADLGREADLFVLECSFPEGRGMDNHLTPSEAGAAAGRANARKLILTHFYPQCEGADIIGPCASRFHGPIVTAEDFMTFEIT